MPTQRSRFGSIRKRGKRYYGQYRIDGKVYYTRTKDTKAAVRADLTLVEAQLLADEWKPPKKKIRQSPYKNSPTLSDWGLMWLERLEQEGRSQGTIRSYRSSWNAHVCRVLGKNTKLASLTDESTRELYQDLISNHSSSVRYNVMRAFSSATKRAEEEGLLEKAPQLPSGSMSTPRRKRTPVTLNTTQLQKLIETVPPAYKAAIALGAWGALRSGEVAALRRNDFPADCSTVRVDESTKRDVDGHTIIGLPKTQSSEREVALPRPAREVVKHHLDYLTGGAADAFLFPAPRSSGPISDKTLLTVLRNAAVKLGLPERIVFHDLRHTGLTLYGRAGATTADLMARAGHSSAETVQIYQHSSAVRDRELTERMALD